MIRTCSASNTSASSVTFTEPSSEFSIGTTEFYAAVAHRQHGVVDRLVRDQVQLSAACALRTAAWVKVPSGPR